VRYRGFGRRYSSWLAGGLILALVISGSAFLAADLEGAERLLSENTVITTTSASFQAENDTYPRPDQACRLCHSNSDKEVEFASGETLPVLVDIEAISDSAHGIHADPSLLCTDCHALTDYMFPHAPVEEPDLRSYEVTGSATCERCHQQPHLTGHPGSESENPVVCTDCHQSHEVMPVDQWQSTDCHQSHEVMPVDQWQSGDGSDVCVECHTESGVPITDSLQLTQIVRDGLTHCMTQYMEMVTLGRRWSVLTVMGELHIRTNRQRQRVHGNTVCSNIRLVDGVMKTILCKPWTAFTETR